MLWTEEMKAAQKVWDAERTRLIDLTDQIAEERNISTYEAGEISGYSRMIEEKRESFKKRNFAGWVASWSKAAELTPAILASETIPVHTPVKKIVDDKPPQHAAPKPPGESDVHGKPEHKNRTPAQQAEHEKLKARVKARMYAPKPMPVVPATGKKEVWNPWNVKPMQRPYNPAGPRFRPVPGGPGNAPYNPFGPWRPKSPNG